MRGTGYKADRWPEQGWVVGIIFKWQVLQRTQGSGLEQAQNYNRKGKKQPRFEKALWYWCLWGRGILQSKSTMATFREEAEDGGALLMMVVSPRGQRAEGFGELGW